MFTEVEKNEESLRRAYQEAVEFTKSHYENFPVISFFLPKRIYKHVAVVYQFARTADDIADNFSEPVEKRLIKLNRFRDKLTSSLDDKFSNEFWMALRNTILNFQLNPINFIALLDAFEHDLRIASYETLEEVFNYCSNSANPVGRIILELLGIKDTKYFEMSDKICTALQITNFIQDARTDITAGRIYFPKEMLEKHGVPIESLKALEYTPQLKRLLAELSGLLEKMYYEGRPMLNVLPYRMKVQIGATINGGLMILEKIKKNEFNVFNYRPKLSKLDFVKIFAKTILTAE